MTSPRLTREEATDLIRKHGNYRAAAIAAGTTFHQIYTAMHRGEKSESNNRTWDEPEDPDKILREREEEFERQRIEMAAVKRVNATLQRQLIVTKARTEDLVRAVHEAAYDAAISLGPIGPTPRPPKDNRNKTSETALWHLTDWQGAKVTTSYNSDVMVQRVMRFCEKAEGITKIQRADHPVNKGLLAFGGDMGEGLFNFPSQVFEVDMTLFGQFVKVSKLIVDTVQYALSIYDEVEVVPEWGNHGRIGSKRDAVPRADNFDRMIYEMARQLLSSEKRLKWRVDHGQEDIQRIEIGNYRALSIHGDEIGRNGFASPMTILRHANQWRSGSYPWEFRDVYVGHYHTHAEWAMANGMGTVYQTGSTESDNRYARETMAASAIPSQRLHFIDPIEGRVTAQYKVFVSDKEGQGGF